MFNTADAQARVIANAPAKVAHYLQKAADRGLSVGLTESTYWISSPNPIDDSQLWLHFTAGSRGGTLTLIRYMPTMSTKRSDTTKLTRAQATYWIDDMGDALDRHHAREAATTVGTFTAQRHAHATDLSRAARTDAVSQVKATPAQPAADEANVALSTLRANGRFALRAARNGHIARNTPAKVRAALINRGLVDVAGGILTDIGRAARQVLINA